MVVNLSYLVILDSQLFIAYTYLCNQFSFIIICLIPSSCTCIYEHTFILLARYIHFLIQLLTIIFLSFCLCNSNLADASSVTYLHIISSSFFLYKYFNILKYIIINIRLIYYYFSTIKLYCFKIILF